jgi:DNA polymerase III delta subunit
MNTTLPTPAFVTVLSGDDSISREHARQSIIESVRAAGGIVAEERYDPESEQMAGFIARILTPSLFATTRIFCIRHGEALSEEDLAELGAALVRPIEGVYVIVEGRPAGRPGKGGKKAPGPFDRWRMSMSRKAAKDSGIAVMEFTQPREYQMAKWIVEKTPQLFGRKISHQNAGYLLDLAGPDVGSLYSELQKIDIHLPAGAAVDHAAIRHITEAAREASPFELARAVGAKDVMRTLELIESLFGGKFYAPFYVTVLFRHFWALLRIRKYEHVKPGIIKRFAAACRDFNSRTAQNELGMEIGRAAGVLGPDDEPSRVYPVVILSGIVQHAALYTEPQLESIMKMLLEFELDVKTGRTDPVKQVFQIFCFRIIRAGELQRAS